MLILGRKVGEGVSIQTSDGEIRFWVDRRISNGSGVRLLIEAPKECVILRIDEHGESQVKSSVKGGVSK